MDSGNTRAVKAGIGYTVGNILVKGIAFLHPLFIPGIRHRETIAAAVKALRDTREAPEENPGS